MSKILLFVLLLFATGCMTHWAPVSSIDDAVGAHHVRIVADEMSPVELTRPSAAEIFAHIANAEHVRVQVRKVNAWAAALVITGSVLASAFMGFVILGAAVAGNAGG